MLLRKEEAHSFWSMCWFLFRYTHFHYFVSVRLRKKNTQLKSLIWFVFVFRPCRGFWSRYSGYVSLFYFMFEFIYKRKLIVLLLSYCTRRNQTIKTGFKARSFVEKLMRTHCSTAASLSLSHQVHKHTIINPAWRQTWTEATFLKWFNIETLL